MTASEYVAFVTWATHRDPQWTLSRRAYVQARWCWRQVSRTVAKTQHSFG